MHGQQAQNCQAMCDLSHDALQLWRYCAGDTGGVVASDPALWTQDLTKNPVSQKFTSIHKVLPKQGAPWTDVSAAFIYCLVFISQHWSHLFT